MSRTKYLISVIKRGLVVALHWSSKLTDIPVIRALHPGCDIDVHDIGVSSIEEKVYDDGIVFTHKRRVRCIETNKLYDTTLACAVDMQLRVIDVAKALRKHCDAGGYHFEYFPARNDKKKRRKWK